MPRTLIDYDVNVYCPELLDGQDSHYDPYYWKMAFRDYDTLEYLPYNFQLSREFVKALGLDKLAMDGTYESHPELETWMDGGLDCWISLDTFIELYRNVIEQTLWIFLSELPKYRESLEVK